MATQEQTRERKRIAAQRFRDKLKSDHEAYRVYLDNLAARRREIYAKNRRSPEFVEKHRKRIREYNKTDKGREIQRNQMAKCRENIQFRLADRCRGRICDALRRVTKSARTEGLIGCSIDQLKQHLESQFRDGMSWSNWGNGYDKWNIDHIRPCASFDLSDPAQQKECFHYTNLQPMWFLENCSKNSIVEGVKQYYPRAE